MTRVLSGAALIACAVGAVWFAPPVVFKAVAFLLLLAATIELVGLARASRLAIPMGPPIVGALLTLAAMTFPASFHVSDATPLLVVLLAQAVGICGLALGGWRGGPDALARVSVSLFPSLYLALPIGALVAIRQHEGPAALFLLMLTVIASDTAQYYTGRLLGRRPLAPSISPKKTLEGALGGVVVGTLVFALVGVWWLARMPLALRVPMGVTIVALGIAGDLFESMLKRSAGVKDSSGLIPGHGGVLDRIDALLFAAPAYYVVLQYAQ